MKLRALLLAAGSALAVVPSAPAADGAAPKGIELGDLDRAVAPCDDFFEFANGR